MTLSPLPRPDLIGRGQGRYGAKAFLKDAKKSTLKRRKKLPKVGLVMSMPIFPFTILTGASSTETKKIMTSMVYS